MNFGSLLLSSVCAVLAAPAIAQDSKAAPASSEVPVSMCIGCHAIPGYQASFPYVYRVPKIGGQSQQYIEAALKAYRQGIAQSSVDDGGGKGLTDQQISAVAAYYAARGDSPVVAVAK